jgi:hypothetical protein
MALDCGDSNRPLLELSRRALFAVEDELVRLSLLELVARQNANRCSLFAGSLTASHSAHFGISATPSTCMARV